MRIPAGFPEPSSSDHVSAGRGHIDGLADLANTAPMVTKRRALTNVCLWGVVGCALGVVASRAPTPTSLSRMPALPGWAVTYIAWGPNYALRLTQEGATFVIASPPRPQRADRTQTDLPELEAAPGERRPAVLTRELLLVHESLELDAKRAELRSVQLRLD